MSGNFELVREGFAAAGVESLRKMGVECKATTPLGDWLQILCPLCEDKSGSASISIKSGYLNCHQCGVKDELFGWWGQKHNLPRAKPYEACVSLADALGVSLPVIKKLRRQRFPKEMTQELLDACKHSLLADEDHEHLREFLRKRHLFDHAWLDKLGIGALNGCLIFSQWTVDGVLRLRYRIYNPATPKQPWGWSKAVQGEAGPIGFWPWLGGLPTDGRVLLCEGEWDTMTALMRLNVPFAVTWTGGGGAPIPQHVIPEAWHRKDIEIVYDNDTFQGPSESAVAPSDQKRAEMNRRRKNLIDGVAESFNVHRCVVTLLKIPLDPLVLWGGDLRDWVDAGGTSLEQLQGFPLAEMRRTAPKAKDVSFPDTFVSIGERVKVRCQVAAISADTVLVPLRSNVLCDMGQKAACLTCKGPQVAPSGIIDWAGLQEPLAQALTRKDSEEWIVHNVIQKPKNCGNCRVTTLEGEPGAVWSAQAKEGSDDTRCFEVISSSQPPLAGDIDLDGFVYSCKNSVVLMADKCTPLDKQQLNYDLLRNDLQHLCPSRADTIEEINAYFTTRHADLSNNVTHIYGRPKIHLAIDLAMHSALWFHHDGLRRRGFIDCCVIGNTRSGKSGCAAAYLAHVGLGQHYTPIGNFSRAGIIGGAVQSQQGGMQRMKPGLLPRNHGKLVVLDEAHLMIADTQIKREAVFPMLQSARDNGRVEGSKIYGSHTLPAAVRLVAMANWLRGGKRGFTFPCQHLLALYGSPEALGRLDFAVGVGELEENLQAEDCPHDWTPELARALIARAWNQTEDQVHITKEAAELARRRCDEWGYRYSGKLPLYTDKEKVFSILRIAISCANLCMSFHKNEVTSCEVREVHVEWACQFLEETWKELGYDRYSMTEISGRKCRLPFLVEAKIYFVDAIQEAVDLQRVANFMHGTIQKDELRALLGLPLDAFEKWVISMVRFSVFEHVREGHGPSLMRLTSGGEEVFSNMLMMAEDFPEVFAPRKKELLQWYGRFGHQPGLVEQSDTPPPEGLLPINATTALLRNEWGNFCDGTTNLVPGPGSSATG